MVVEVVAGVGLILSKLEMRVATTLLRPAAGEVLHRDLNAAMVQRFALDALNESRGNLADQIGVLCECLGDAEPPGFGRKIEAVAIHSTDAERHPFTRDRSGEFGDEVHIAGRCQTCLFRPRRERADGGVQSAHATFFEVVTRVGFEESWNAETRRFAHLLHGVGELRHFVRGDLHAEERMAGFGRRVRDGVAEDEAAHLLLIH